MNVPTAPANPEKITEVDERELLNSATADKIGPGLKI